MTLRFVSVSLLVFGFAATFSRGSDWAASGKVTQPVPKGIPTPEAVGVWK